MRELRGWIATFLAIQAGWIIYLLINLSAADTLVYEQESSLELSPFHTMLFVPFLLLSTGLLLVAAIARAFTILCRTIF